MGVILSIDISTRTGYAVFDGGKLRSYGKIENMAVVSGFGPYPWSFLRAASSIVTRILDVVKRHNPETIVIEETNISARSTRYVQKILEFIHCSLLRELDGGGTTVAYVNTSAWRKVSGIELSKEQRKSNAKLSRAKSEARKYGRKLSYEDKQELGIRGKITKKHLAVHRANELFGLQLKQVDNDKAEAILLGYAAITGVPYCDGR